VRDPLAQASGGLSRQLDTLEIPLERLDRIREPLGVTLNDLLLAAVTGMLAAYHRERGVSVRALRCLVPMNLRGRDARDELGNRVGLISVWLPLAERNPARRLRALERQTRTAKRDRRGAASPFLMEAVALLPGVAFRWLARHSLGRVNAVCTNIRGPHEACQLAGQRVSGLFPFAPVVEGTPLAVAALSYAGMLEVGIDTDRECIRDPERIGELLEAELEAYAALSSRRASTAASARRRCAGPGPHPAAQDAAH
jgi:WS/DGAT/MGAT family acyltransferase